MCQFDTQEGCSVCREGSKQCWTQPWEEALNPAPCPIYFPCDLGHVGRAGRRLQFRLYRVDWEDNQPHGHPGNTTGDANVGDADGSAHFWWIDMVQVFLRHFVRSKIQCTARSVSCQSGQRTFEQGLDTALFDQLFGGRAHGLFPGGVSLQHHFDTFGRGRHQGSWDGAQEPSGGQLSVGQWALRGRVGSHQLLTDVVTPETDREDRGHPDQRRDHALVEAFEVVEHVVAGAQGVALGDLLQDLGNGIEGA